MEYQEKINLDIENIANTSRKCWRSIYEVIHDDYFKAVRLSPTQFLEHCKKRKWTSKHTKRIQNSLKKGFGKRVVCKSGYDTQKEHIWYKRIRKDKKINSQGK